MTLWALSTQHPFLSPSFITDPLVGGGWCCCFLPLFSLAILPPSGAGEGDLISSSRRRSWGLVPITGTSLKQTLRPKGLSATGSLGKVSLLRGKTQIRRWLFIFSGHIPVWAWGIELQAAGMSLSSLGGSQPTEEGKHQGFQDRLHKVMHFLMFKPIWVRVCCGCTAENILNIIADPHLLLP